MSKAIISVENLGKKYRIAHQGERQRYTALRDVLAEKAKSIFRSRKPEAGSRGAETGGQKPEAGPSPSSVLRPPSSGTEDFWALRDVSFEVKRGEVVGIIGRNGAGKSTLLKILSRITEPTTGRVHLKGRVASLLEVGTGFHPELTGRENIFLNGAILGMSRAEIRKKFDEIVDFSGVEKFLDTPVKRYSSGMYVRLAFAVAAHLEPEILIVDEVLAVGDAQFQKKCLGKMGDVAKKLGRTVLFVSHNTSAVRSLCSRCLYLQNGSLAMSGETTEVLACYASDVQSGGATRITGFEQLLIENVSLLDDGGRPCANYPTGSSLTIDIDYSCPRQIDLPYFWLEIYSMHGATFSACMLFDGARPEYIKGCGKLRCRFHYLPLMPGSYTVRMAARMRDGVTPLLRLQEVACFNIIGDFGKLGFAGELVSSLSIDAAPVVLPYTWLLPDGTTKSIRIAELAAPVTRDPSPLGSKG